MANEWQKNLSFSERLAATSKMHQNYLACCEDSAQLLHNSLEPALPVDAGRDQHVQSSLPETGVQIGRYVNAQHFKDGLFSEIFRAMLPGAIVDSDGGTVVALKITTPSAMSPPHDSEREARILHAVESDRVIRVLETFKLPGGRFVLVCPFMPYDLETLLQRQQLADHSRKSILRDLFSGLAHLHDLGIIHRDIKPSNILLSSPTGPAFIADFGIAWCLSEASKEPAHEKILDVGTTCYRPPELLFGNAAYGTSLDLWAAGCVAAQVVCLNGSTLFDAGDLGSELALIKSIFETLGTPNLARWPEAATFPDWGKMNFREYPGWPWQRILPGTEPNAIGLVGRLVVYESSQRLPAAEALKHPYLSETPS